jgi:hypothetical protein
MQHSNWRCSHGRQDGSWRDRLRRHYNWWYDRAPTRWQPGDNVPVIDATVLSAALYTSLGLCPSSGVTSGASGAFFCNDTTHFEKAGALQIAQMVGKALKDQGIGLAAYLVN